MTNPHLMTHIRRKHNRKVPDGTKTLTRGVGRPQHTFKRHFSFSHRSNFLEKTRRLKKFPLFQNKLKNSKRNKVV